MLQEETLKARPSKSRSHLTAVVGVNAEVYGEGNVRKKMYESRRHARSDLDQKLIWKDSGMPVTSSSRSCYS